MTRMPTTSGVSQTRMIGTPATASDPLIVARTPIKEPTEISILPDTITNDMPLTTHDYAPRHRDIGVAKHDVGEVSRRKKARVVEADQDRNADDRESQQGLLRGEQAKRAALPRPQARNHHGAHAALPASAPWLPIIAVPTASGVAFARENSATSRPSRITNTRSLMPRTSGNSL